MGDRLIRANRQLARVPGAARLAVKARNQCNLLIAHAVTGGREPRHWMSGEVALIECAAPTCSTFVDIGANVGQWTQYLLDAATGPVAGVVVEPSSQGAARLRDRFRDRPEIDVVVAAAGDATGPETITFYEEDDAGQNSSVLENPGRVRGASERMVPVVTVEALVAEREWEYIDILKIDTEGYDLHVLRGASALLRERRVGVVQFEYSYEWTRARSTLAEALNLLEGCGYSVYVQTPTGLRPCVYEPWLEFYSGTNLVALVAGSPGPFQRLLS